jgi:hypothetical protein
MADDLILNPGAAGSTLRTDELGTGQHVQYVKLMDGTADGTDVAHIDGTLGLAVDVTDRAARDLGKVDIASIDGPINGGTEAAALRVTIANDSTGLVSVDDNAGSLTIDNADITLCKTALELLDNSVDGNYLNVNANIAGTDFVGGAGAVAAGVQRTTLASDDPAVTALQLIDNAISGAGFNITQIGSAAAPIGAGVEATAVRVTLPTDGTGKVTAVSGTAANLKAEITIAGAQTLSTVTTVSTVSAVSAVTCAAANAKVDVGLLGGAAVPIGAGASATALRVETAASSPDVTSLAIMDDWDSAGSDSCSVVGDVAHGTADAGEPVKNGAKAIEHTDTAAVVHANDRTDLYADLDGLLITQTGCAKHVLKSFHIANTDGAEDAVTGLGAVAATFNYITAVVIHNTHATTNGFVQLLDGSAGTAFATFPAPATGGCAINFSPPLKQPTTNTALYLDISAAITTVYVTIVGFQSLAG